MSKHSKCTLYCNLAVAMVAQDKIPHAQQLVGQALLALPNAAPALLIVRPSPALLSRAGARALPFSRWLCVQAAYLELRQGNTEGASKLLKKRRAAPTARERSGRN